MIGYLWPIHFVNMSQKSSNLIFGPMLPFCSQRYSFAVTISKCVHHWESNPQIFCLCPSLQIIRSVFCQTYFFSKIIGWRFSPPSPLHETSFRYLVEIILKDRILSIIWQNYRCVSLLRDLLELDLCWEKFRAIHRV